MAGPWQWQCLRLKNWILGLIHVLMCSSSRCLWLKVCKKVLRCNCHSRKTFIIIEEKKANTLEVESTKVTGWRFCWRSVSFLITKCEIQIFSLFILLASCGLYNTNTALQCTYRQSLVKPLYKLQVNNFSFCSWQVWT